MRNIFFISIVCARIFANAEPFDSFLTSLQKKYPINTEFMQTVLKTHKTKLALPSLLEKWGVINQDAAATYNGILNTVVLKPEYTAVEILPNGKTKRRVKTLTELKQSEPAVWAVRAGTVFHELSHAEFDWLPKSKDSVDIILLKLLRTDFEEYLKKNHVGFSSSDRKIARSELFAYFRDEFFANLANKFDDVLLENGYFISNNTCRNTNMLINQLSRHPEMDVYKFVSFGPDIDFTTSSLPVVFVKGKDAEINTADPINEKLKHALWAQLAYHYAPAKSKQELIHWMNSQEALLALIRPCRSLIAPK